MSEKSLEPTIFSGRLPSRRPQANLARLHVVPKRKLPIVPPTLNPRETQNTRLPMARTFVIAVWVSGLLLVGLWPLVASSSVSSDLDSEKADALPTRIYVGMWTSHLRRLHDGLDANSLIGVSHRGFFGATFINSYGNRAISAGIRRDLTPAREGSLTTVFGYRIGLVTGYDERFLGLASKIPAIPFVQFVGSVDYRHVGIEFSYAGLVTSIATNWRF